MPPYNSSKSTRRSKPAPETEGRLQPQAVDLEKAVIGALLIERDAYFRVNEILQPQSFYDPRHQIIYEAIQSLNVENQPMDILTVTDKLQRMGKIEEAGGAPYITALSGMVLSSAHIEYHANIIAQKATARALITYTSGIEEKAFDVTQDIDKLMQEAEGGLFEISQKNLKKEIGRASCRERV